ncbi:MAG: branched-chain amino acid ABC transporter permease [Roseovarius sp.]
MSQLLLSIVTFGCLFSVLTLSLNLQYARGGMINFGLVAYFAAGAYAYAIVTQEPPRGLDQYLFGFNAPWWAGFLAAGVAAMAFALLTGWPTLRLRGEYLALTTFAFAEMLHSFLLNERRIGNGTVGLSNVHRPQAGWLGIPQEYLFAGAALVLMLATALLFSRLLASPYGRAIDAIHDDEVAAQVVGKDVRRMRFQVFVISAIPMGLAGALYAMITTLVNPDLFTAEVTFFVWIALVLGGERRMLGAILGTVALVTLQEVVRAIPFETVRAAQIAASVENVLTGIVFIIILRWQPFEAMFRRRMPAPAATEAGA